MVRKQTTSSGVGIVTSNVVDLSSDPTVETIDVSDATAISLSMGIDSNLDGTVDGGFIEINGDRTYIGKLANIPSRSSDPSSGEAGDTYLNTSSGRVVYYDGASWITLDVSGGLSVHDNTYHSPHFLPVDGSEEMAATAGARIKINQDGSSSWSNELALDDGTTEYWIRAYQGINFRDHTAGTSLATFSTSGAIFEVDVGIGVTPSSALHVKSPAVSTLFGRFESSTGYVIAGIAEDATGDGEFTVRDSTGTIVVQINAGSAAYFNEYIQIQGGNYLYMWDSTNSENFRIARTADATYIVAGSDYIVYDAPTGHFWRLGGTNYAFINSSGDFVAAYRGNSLYVYDSAHTDYVQMYHTGTVGNVYSTGYLQLRCDSGDYIYMVEGSTAFLRFYESGGGVISSETSADLNLRATSGQAINFLIDSTTVAYFDGTYFALLSGNILLVNDSTNSYNVQVYHDGNGWFKNVYGNTVLTGPSNIDIYPSGGNYVRIIDATYNYYSYIVHDSTNGIIGSSYGHLVYSSPSGSGHLFQVGGTTVAQVGSNGDIVDYGHAFVAYDSTTTYYGTMYHTGTALAIGLTGTAKLNLYETGDISMVNGGFLRVFDSANTEQIAFGNDGSYTKMTSTTPIKIRSDHLYCRLEDDSDYADFDCATLTEHSAKTSLDRGEIWKDSLPPEVVKENGGVDVGMMARYAYWYAYDEIEKLREEISELKNKMREKKEK